MKIRNGSSKRELGEIIKQLNLSYIKTQNPKQNKKNPTSALTVKEIKHPTAINKLLKIKHDYIAGNIDCFFSKTNQVKLSFPL